MLTYTHTLPQLLTLHSVSEWLARNDLFNQDEIVKESLVRFGKLKRTLGFMSVQNKIAADPTDISYLFTEWLKMFLLIEPIVFIYSIHKVNRYRREVQVLFESVGEIDMAISVLSLRLSMPHYCLPKFSSTNQITIEGLYHPLIENCVANSITVNSLQGNLLTGSNMSGKTTFIRALAVNVLLSQTLNTCCAHSYEAPALNLLTSVRTSDNLSDHTSYFQAEAIALKGIIDKCDESITSNFVIVDEIFKGTNTIERISAAKAVISYLIVHNTFVLVSTHDLELAELLGSTCRIFSFEEIIENDKVVFDYKIKDGLLKNKNGIAVLKRLGYPNSIIEEASAISSQLRKLYNLN